LVISVYESCEFFFLQQAAEKLGPPPGFERARILAAP
jgi:hypothetical protein